MGRWSHHWLRALVPQALARPLARRRAEPPGSSTIPPPTGKALSHPIAPPNAPAANLVRAAARADGRAQGRVLAKDRPARKSNAGGEQYVSQRKDQAGLGPLKSHGHKVHPKPGAHRGCGKGDQPFGHCARGPLVVSRNCYWRQGAGRAEPAKWLRKGLPVAPPAPGIGAAGATQVGDHGEGGVTQVFPGTGRPRRRPRRPSPLRSATERPSHQPGVAPAVTNPAPAEWSGHKVGSGGKSLVAPPATCPDWVPWSTARAVPGARWCRVPAQRRSQAWESGDGSLGATRPPAARTSRG
jgi:hypothetical protein